MVIAALDHGWGSFSDLLKDQIAVSSGGRNSAESIVFRNTWNHRDLIEIEPSAWVWANVEEESSD